LHRKILEDLQKLENSENVNEDAVQQWVDEDSKLECYDFLSGNDVVPRVTCSYKETKNFEECLESDEENLVAHQK